MVPHSALFLTANSKDVSDSQGSCSYCTHDDKIIGNVGKRRTKEKIRNDTKISITNSKENNCINTDIVNSNSAGENDKCEEQRRESVAFRNEEDLRQRLEKEKNDAKDLCEKHDSYEVKWDGERDTEEDQKKCKEQCRESFVFRNEEDVR